MKKLSKLLLIGFLFLSVSYNAQNYDFTKIDSKINELMKVWNIPGCSIAIVKDSILLYSKGYGYADLESKREATPNTIYGIASCSKAISGCALGILADQGKFDWKKTVNYYMPDFILSDPYITSELTALDLFSHRTGYPANDFLWYGSKNTRKDLVKLMRYISLSKSFRSYFQYNNLMYVAAGELIERVSGDTWENVVQNNIFEPLEMKNSSCSIHDLSKFTDVASRYRMERGELLHIDFYNADNIGAAGSINSTVMDMSHWLIMQLNKGTYNGKQIVKPSTLAFLQKPVTVVNSSIDYPELDYLNYGIGWYVTAYQGDLFLRHAGALDGVSTLTSFMPNQKVGVIIIANLDGAKNFTMASTLFIYDVINGNEPVDWNKRFLDEKARNEEQSLKAKEETEKNIVKNTKPSHNLSDYIGTYSNTPYGKFEVKLKGETLSFNYNTFSFNLKHVMYDIFEIENEYVFEYMKIHFESDMDGNVRYLFVPMEGKLEDFKFTKE